MADIEKCAEREKVICSSNRKMVAVMSATPNLKVFVIEKFKVKIEDVRRIV